MNFMKNLLEIRNMKFVWTVSIVRRKSLDKIQFKFEIF